MKMILLAFLLLTYIGCDKPANSDLQIDDELVTIISRFEEELKSDLAKDNIGGSISAAIVSENKVIWSKAFGYPDKDSEIAADTTTIYRAASISKSFTAFLMMQLADEGVIGLSDPVDRYVPELKSLLGYSDTTRFTLLQLASHTAGLSREPQLKDAASGPIAEWEQKLIASIATTHFIGKPGTRFSYSNIGFGILGLALSRAAGKPFMDLVHEKIFSPLNMKNSFYIVPDLLKPRLAVGIEGGPADSIDMDSPKAEHKGRGYKIPNGGIYSTPNDLAKFMITNLAYNPILKKESLEMMQTEKAPSNSYGLGFMIFSNEKVNIIGHNGRVLGYTSQFAFEKNSGFGVILMRNYTSGATDLDKVSFVLLSKLRELKK